ncbi:DNA polymerase III subunit beta [Aphanothece hegewaldii CCALA 016]|uniref:Beta sliding clamp n=1 Tax=Aphanothece hegewaldii CCALA 016 TaxID=2107694 RepID=A0A2T1LTM4_9CHRO|nr:DNA polymerase III subunit beta [Aphanothece hegewaldii]PSF34263.1 DNA polymerase III subunit beta [Aphanothece hegewaldii CCALA 016]
MKFTCAQNELNTNLSLVSRAVPSRPNHPVLGNVLFVADEEKGEISLTAFDLSLGIKTSFQATVSESGTVTLPAKLLNDIVSRLSDGEITLVVEEQDDAEEQILATLTSVSGRFQLRGMLATEFPQLPSIENGETIILPITALTEGLKASLFAASTDETKQVLTGVHLTGTPDSLEFAATDGHRLSVVQTPLEEAETSNITQGFGVTIPARTLRELERILSVNQTTDLVTLRVDEGQIIFEIGDQKLTSRKLEGAYPAYQQLIPKKFDRSVTLERKRLLSSLERVAVLADQKNNLVKFSLDGDKGQLTLSVESPDLGSAKELMPAEMSGDNTDIAFNVKYLMDGLKALPASQISMQLNESTQPVIFSPLDGLKMTYLVMPVQIRN